MVVLMHQSILLIYIDVNAKKLNARTKESAGTTRDSFCFCGDVATYHLAHPAGTALPRLGRTADVRASYERALRLTQQEPEQRFLEKVEGTAGGTSSTSSCTVPTHIGAVHVE